MVVKQFKDVLCEEGVEEIPSEGSHFNPKFHEAVGVTEGPDEGRIVKVMIKGYKINDKVIRPAKVMVEKKIECKKEEKEFIGGENV
jgi:molecular chaperone GrpE